MRIAKLSIGVAALVHLMLVPAVAGQRGNSGTHGPSAHATPSHPSPPANAGPKTTHGPTSGPSTKATGPTSHTSHAPANAGSSAKNTGAGKKGPASTTTTSNTTSTSTTVATTATTIDFAAAPLGQKLTKNVALQSKLQTQLERLGYDGTVFEAAYGFRNLGQFVAATNVSQNLGIPFEQLKLQMTGLTVDATGTVLTSSTTTKSLGQSIQTLKPGADATTTAQTATVEAEDEIETTSNTTTTTKANKKK